MPFLGDSAIADRKIGDSGRWKWRHRCGACNGVDGGAANGSSVASSTGNLPKRKGVGKSANKKYRLKKKQGNIAADATVVLALGDGYAG